MLCGHSADIYLQGYMSAQCPHYILRFSDLLTLLCGNWKKSSVLDLANYHKEGSFSMQIIFHFFYFGSELQSYQIKLSTIFHS